MFEVIVVSTGEILISDLATGHEAEKIAIRYSNILGKKCQPRVMKADNWKSREVSRLLGGAYTSVPFDRNDWFREHKVYKEHFAHVSKKELGKISFTANENDGIRDIKTHMSPGRYLTTFYSDVLCRQNIEGIANDFASRYEPLHLNFATTPDEIERIYMNGPRSCMAGSHPQITSSVHPTRVYGAGDLAVAYLSYVNENGKECISARSVCWPARKIYGRVYGNSSKLIKALEDKEFKRNDNDFEGARLLRIKENDKFIMPYLECGLSVKDYDDEYFIISRVGIYTCICVNGFAYIAVECPHCNRTFNPETSMISVIIDATNEEIRYCNSCTPMITYICNYDGLNHRGNPILMGNNQYWSPQAYSQFGFQCEGGSGKWHLREKVIIGDGIAWSREFFRKNGKRCIHCDRAMTRGEICRCNEVEEQIPFDLNDVTT